MTRPLTQLGMFDLRDLPPPPVAVDDFDHLADDAEAVVYMISAAPNGMPGRCLFVMRRSEAQRFCDDPRTTGTGAYGGHWAYAFTTHRRDWREDLDAFRRDDSRMDALLTELGIEPIYRGGGAVPREIPEAQS